MIHRDQKPARVLVKEMHEPSVPQTWPDGHVAVILTGLHSTTARELSNMLVARAEEWNVVVRAAGAPGV